MPVHSSVMQQIYFTWLYFKPSGRALVNMVINLWIPYVLGCSRVAAQLAASREGFSSIKLVIF
jgi:hypothetical protein